MKGITIKLTDEQLEILENISNMCGKTSHDFIKDTMFTILPLNEYIAIRHYLSVLKKLKAYNENQKVVKSLTEIVNDINVSANARLKRIGVL